MPGIEVSADHYDLVSLGRSGDLADDVEAVDGVVGRGGFQVEADAWGGIPIDEAGDAVVLFGGDDEGRGRGYGSGPEAAGRFAEEHAVVCALVLEKDSGDALLSEEF